MRRSLIILGIVAVAVFLGLPMIGYASVKDMGTTVSIDLTARCASATSVNAASYTCSFETSAGGKQSYFSYVGTFWGTLGHTGSVVINYPTVSIVVLDLSTGDRMVNDQYFDYTWGQVWTHSLNVGAEVGQRIHVQVQIFASAGVSVSYQGFDYTVPSV